MNHFTNVWSCLSLKWMRTLRWEIFPNLQEAEQKKIHHYFQKSNYPMLTPMVYVWVGIGLFSNSWWISSWFLGCWQRGPQEKRKDMRSWALCRFLPIFHDFWKNRTRKALFLIPIEEVIRRILVFPIQKCEIAGISLFRNYSKWGFVPLEGKWKDMDANFFGGGEAENWWRPRKDGRVVRIEIEEAYKQSGCSTPLLSDGTFEKWTRFVLVEALGQYD